MNPPPPHADASADRGDPSSEPEPPPSMAHRQDPGAPLRQDDPGLRDDDGPASANSVELLFNDNGLEPAAPAPPLTGWIEPHLHRVLRLCGVTHGRLEMTLVDDATMGPLHEQYCGDPETTDVLTFDLSEQEHDDDRPRESVDGELIICVDEATRQARRRGHDVRLEILLYAVHGLLHLLGEDDHEEADYQRMHRREDQLLRQLGVGDIFAAPLRDASPLAAEVRGC